MISNISSDLEPSLIMSIFLIHHYDGDEKLSKNVSISSEDIILSD